MHFNRFLLLPDLVSLSPPLSVFSLNPGNIQTHTLRLNIQFTFMSIVPNHNISGKLKVQDLKVSLRKTQWNTWKKQGNIDLNVTRLIRWTPPPYNVNFFIFIKGKKRWSPSIFGILAVQKLQHNVGISCRVALLQTLLTLPQRRCWADLDRRWLNVQKNDWFEPSSNCLTHTDHPEHFPSELLTFSILKVYFLHEGRHGCMPCRLTPQASFLGDLLFLPCT